MTASFDEKAVFLQARSLQSEARETFLREACPDPAAIARIRDLIAAHEAASTAASPVARLGVDPRRDSPTRVASPRLPKRIAEFEIINLIDEGGMGTVYLAHDTVLDRRVAVKVLAPHLTGSPDALNRFINEAKSAGALNHPAIVKVHALGFDGEKHYIVSELVDGPTLKAVIEDERTHRSERTKTADVQAWRKRIAEYVISIADALEASHRAGIIHRDVKPSNILIDPVIGARLTDFGIARHLTAEEKARVTARIGSCHYMSPEQASLVASHVDARSDVFSLGVVLYEALSLTRPFDGKDVEQVIRAVIASDPPQLRKCDRSIPRDLETICHKALEKQPERRYQSAAHMAADLRCWLADRPILARPRGLPRRARDWSRRNRTAAMAAMLLFMAITIAGLAWQIRHTRNEKFAWFRLAAPEQCTAYLQAIDDESRQVGPAIALASSTFENRRVTPGQYRLTVVSPDGTAFAEFNLMLFASGSHARTEINVQLESAGARRVAASVGSENSRVRLAARLLPTAAVTASGMVAVEAGDYPFSNQDQVSAVGGNANVRLASFFIDQAEVSNREYKAFIDATGHALPLVWQQLGYPADVPDHPVSGVTPHEAEAYARWVGKRLPTMFEWQAAARGVDGRLMPDAGDGAATTQRDVDPAQLVNQQSASLAEVLNLYRTNTVAVRSGAPDASGLFQTAGNVRELSASVSRSGGSVVIMGLGWSDSPRRVNLSDVITGPIEPPALGTGFRCAKSAEPPSPPADS